MQIRILGPLEILVDGAELMIGPRLRTVLATLIINANKIVSTDQLISATWGEDPPATARSQIHIIVSSLRQGLARHDHRNVILTRSPGYEIGVEHHELDAYEFEDHLAAGRAFIRAGNQLAGVTSLRTALSLWRGDPLPGIDSPLVRTAAARLSEIRLAALEEMIETELQLGRHHQIIGELSAAVTENPLRERLLSQQMIALFRSGRQPEALSACREARQRFIVDHGLTPSDRLRDLEAAILRNDRSVLAHSPDSGPTRVAAPDAASPQLLPAEVWDFAGRADAVEQMQRVLCGEPTDGRMGRVDILAISGRAGAGKTALAIHVAHRLRDRFPDGQLYADLGATGSVPYQVLKQFILALGVPPEEIPERLAERACLFRDLLAGRRVLVVLDDVVTETDVRPLLPGSGGCAVLITSRIRLTTLPGARHLNVGMLDIDDGYAMLGGIVGEDRLAAEPAMALRLVELCDGLPLALRAAGARLAARPHWSIAKFVERLLDRHRRLDELTHCELRVRESLVSTYNSLDSPARCLCRRLAMINTREFRGDVGSALLDITDAESEELMDVLVETHLIDTIEHGPAATTHYRMGELVWIFARERLTTEETMESVGLVVSRWRRMNSYLGSVLDVDWQDLGLVTTRAVPSLPGVCPTPRPGAGGYPRRSPATPLPARPSTHPLSTARAIAMTSGSEQTRPDGPRPACHHTGDRAWPGH